MIEFLAFLIIVLLLLAYADVWLWLFMVVLGVTIAVLAFGGTALALWSWWSGLPPRAEMASETASIVWVVLMVVLIAFGLITHFLAPGWKAPWLRK